VGAELFLACVGGGGVGPPLVAMHWGATERSVGLGVEMVSGAQCKGCGMEPEPEPLLSTQSLA